MRLIDADELLKTLMEEIPLAENVNIFKDIIDTQQTAFDVDKVVEQLDNYPHGGYINMETMNDIIEMVKAGGIE